jgi:hypothetical protein
MKYFHSLHWLNMAVDRDRLAESLLRVTLFAAEVLLILSLSYNLMKSGQKNTDLEREVANLRMLLKNFTADNGSLVLPVRG